MGERWLVTGGCGFLGSTLAAQLLREGVDVVVADDLSRVGSSLNLTWLKEIARGSGRGHFEYIAVDVRDTVAVDQLVGRTKEGLRAVAHLAGQVAMTTSIANPRLDAEINLLGTINVLEAVRRGAQDAIVIFSSTNKVYGELANLRYEETQTRWTIPDWPEGLDESLPLDFRTPYGCSKGAADQYVLDYHHTYGVKTIVLRHSSIYGARQFGTYDQGWVSWFAARVIEQSTSLSRGIQPEPFVISGDGKQVRDLLHVTDAANCYRSAVRSGRGFGDAYNLGGGMPNSLSLIELFGQLQLRIGNAPRFTKQPARMSDQRVFVADSTRASRTFAWKPTVPLGEGLDELVRWTRNAGDRLDT